MNMLKTFATVLIFALIIGTSCEEITDEQTFTIGNESSFRLNRLYTSADGQLSIKLTEVGDSRCPEGVVCVWQGEVSLKGEFTENGKKSTFELHTVLTDRQSQPDGYTLKLVDARPYPKHGVDSKAENLTITLLIQKNKN